MLMKKYGVNYRSWIAKLNKTGDIRESLGVSPQLLNTYRKRLMERGVVDGSRHGELTLALPRFEEYINMYCEVIL